ncbi:hypothetical protein [Rossellomorea marisflavi]|uniref:hypothetical protein n=1 Tax=Rossellomorea marisflavi TaxID=189381 RepID=UPI001EE22A15|nr:hypothetical protein [Rossellomorea marisflavi]UKS66354.1 hypothetical protein K6T23_05715 [Rossellomorea marisflavi]
MSKGLLGVLIAGVLSWYIVGIFTKHYDSKLLFAIIAWGLIGFQTGKKESSSKSELTGGDLCDTGLLFYLYRKDLWYSIFIIFFQKE